MRPLHHNATTSGPPEARNLDYSCPKRVEALQRRYCMFTLSNRIPTDGAPSFINEVCFDPAGETFAASYEHLNEVRLYDARNLSLVRVFRNPAATLNRAHGLALTHRHLIVANKGTSPCQFSVFRLDDPSGTPVQTYTTPFAHLAEGHSIALNAGRLVVTYCEGRGKKGAIVSYDFDDENGRIGRAAG